MTYLDEVASLLIAVPYPQFDSDPDDDAHYGLTVALAEVAESLDASATDKQSAADRATMVADLHRAFDEAGLGARGRMPSANGFLAAMNSYVRSRDPADVTNAQSHLRRLRTEMASPETATAAFDDLVDTVKDPGASAESVRSKLAVFTDMLNLGNKPYAEICHLLGGVVDDQDLEISIAQREVDGTPLRSQEKSDQLAGLSQMDRLELARRYLRQPARVGHHVVWTAYGDARVKISCGRLQVGPITFFDGRTLLEDLDRPATDGDRDLPVELRQQDDPRRGIEADQWPRPEVGPWVAARIDLGRCALANAIHSARVQVDATLQVAVLGHRKSTWVPLAGAVHLVDGRRHSSEAFHPARGFSRMLADNDRTQNELQDIADVVGPHLPVSSPELERVLREVAAVNLSSRSGDKESLTQDFRAIEYVTRRNHHPDWAGFMKDNLATFGAHHQMISEIYQSVMKVSWDFFFPEMPDLRQTLQEPQPDGKVLMKRKSALDLVPQLAPALPQFHQSARRLRDVAERTKSVTAIQQWMHELAGKYKIKVDRAARLRNGMIHGGTAPLEAADTIRHFLNGEARMICRAALEAILAEKPIKETFDGYRARDRMWRKQILHAETVSDVLFDGENP